MRFTVRVACAVRSPPLRLSVLSVIVLIRHMPQLKSDGWLEVHPRRVYAALESFYISQAIDIGSALWSATAGISTVLWIPQSHYKNFVSGQSRCRGIATHLEPAN